MAKKKRKAAPCSTNQAVTKGPAAIKRPSRYRSTAVTFDGIWFQSQKEAGRYNQLKLLQKGGKIRDLRRQVRYPIVIQTVYVADFVYVEATTGKEVVEDVKGFRTQEYIRKRRLMREQHGIEIREV